MRQTFKLTKVAGIVVSAVLTMGTMSTANAGILDNLAAARNSVASFFSGSPIQTAASLAGEVGVTTTINAGLNSIYNTNGGGIAYIFNAQTNTFEAQQSNLSDLTPEEMLAFAADPSNYMYDDFGTPIATTTISAGTGNAGIAQNHDAIDAEADAREAADDAATTDRGAIRTEFAAADDAEQARAEAAEGALDGRLDAINLSAVRNADDETTGELLFIDGNGVETRVRGGHTGDQLDNGHASLVDLDGVAVSFTTDAEFAIVVGSASGTEHVPEVFATGTDGNGVAKIQNPETSRWHAASDTSFTGSSSTNFYFLSSSWGNGKVDTPYVAAHDVAIQASGILGDIETATTDRGTIRTEFATIVEGTYVTDKYTWTNRDEGIEYLAELQTDGTWLVEYLDLYKTEYLTQSEFDAKLGESGVVESSIVATGTGSGGLISDIAANASDISAEETARIAQDLVLDGRVTSEVAALVAADKIIQDDVDANEAAQVLVNGGFKADIATNATAIVSAAAFDLNARNVIVSAQALVNTAIRSEFATADTALDGRLDALEALGLTGNFDSTDLVTEDASIRTDFAAADSALQTNIDAKQDRLTSDEITAYLADNDTVYDDTAVRGLIDGKQATLTNAQIASYLVDNDTIYDDTAVRGLIDGKQATLTNAQIASYLVDTDTQRTDGEIGYVVNLRLAVLANIDVGASNTLESNLLSATSGGTTATANDKLTLDNHNRLDTIGASDYRVKEIFVDTTGDGNADSWVAGTDVYANAEEAANAGEVVWRYSEAVAHANGFTDFSAPDTQAHVGFLAQEWERLGARNVYTDTSGVLHVDTLSILGNHEVRITGNAAQIVANDTIDFTASSAEQAARDVLASGGSLQDAKDAYTNFVSAQNAADTAATNESELSQFFRDQQNAVTENRVQIDNATSDRALIRLEGRAGTASAMAADNVAFPSSEGTFVGGGIGSYAGESAQAMGISHKDGKLALRGVMTRDSFAKGYSVGFQYRIK